ncbi:MAG: NAD(P)H-hydrate epimerase [Dehalococcoidia bacterium]
MSANGRLHFTAPDGARVPAASIAEMREVTRVAVDDTGPSLQQMVEHAGMQLALSAIDLLGPHWRSARVVVLCGPGRTGGGGVCAARHLANRGVGVEVVTITAPQRADGYLGQQFLALAEAPATVTRWDEAFDAGAADLVVDAVLGTGLHGEPQAVPRGLIRASLAATEAGVPVLSLDVPSGVDADTGEAPGDVVRPVRTLTLGLPKAGLSRANAGDLWVADVGLPPGVFARAGLAFAPFFGSCGRLPLRYPGERLNG